ncbi:enoyl-CoA hydratase/isomerase family protein [Cereibacter changlensis]|uniref:enoyl-CoA hydratase/isomerase family protein n=1 Tax=Cereibacter changlensis TaxID=402884 RepID=UPI001B7FF33A|nr:enoyl-CoA hydratase/isomerase family protein [Cereibacter changlensis]
MSGKVHLERDGAVAVLVIDNPPVNAGSAAVRRALLARIAEVEADPALTAGVLIGAGKSFIAGSDLREFDLPLADPQLPQVIAALEGSAKPWVAALHGAALGGGYELALGPRPHRRAGHGAGPAGMRAGDHSRGGRHAEAAASGGQIAGHCADLRRNPGRRRRGA